MTGLRLLAEMVALLDAAGIPHMVAGSYASSLYGEPRTTADVDIVIDPEPEQLRRFVDGVDGQRFYLSDALGAPERRDMFNVIEASTGWKVDLIIRKDRPFSHSEFERRVRVEVDGVPVYMATAEDTILAKLEWGRAGGSERQLRDVEGILSVSGESLDLAYLGHWAGVLGVTAELEQAMRQAG